MSELTTRRHDPKLINRISKVEDVMERQFVVAVNHAEMGQVQHSTSTSTSTDLASTSLSIGTQT